MSTLRIEFFEFELNETAFIKHFIEQFTKLMIEAAKFAYRCSIRLIPVWTGESRGGFRALAKKLKLPLGGVFPAGGVTGAPGERRKRRRNRFGRLKGPTSALSEVDGPRIAPPFKMIFTITNMADGYTFNDRSAHSRGPWNFANTFTRKMIQDMKINAPKMKMNITRFAFKKRISG